MQEKAQVVGFEGKKVVVIPVDISCCINCDNSSCKSNGHRFFVQNSKNIPIQVGSQVKVAAPLKLKTKEAIFALVLPILMGVLGFVLSTVFFFASTETFKVGISLLFLGITAFIVYQHGVRKADNALPMIIDIL